MNENFTYPDWVNWIAQDEDGRWWGFSVEPLEHSTGWYENEVGRYVLLYIDKPNINWKKSLTKISTIEA